MNKSVAFTTLFVTFGTAIVCSILQSDPSIDGSPGAIEKTRTFNFKDICGWNYKSSENTQKTKFAIWWAR